MANIISSPGSYIQGEGTISELCGYYQQLGSKGAYLIVDSFIEKTYHNEIISSFEKAHQAYTLSVFGGECSDPEVDRQLNCLGSCDVIFGIGGGKTLDTAKAAAHKAGLPVIIIPTAASSDAPCSRLAVVYKENHEFDHYLPLPRNPQMVVVDTDVITKAPVRFLRAGIADALATFYEADACRRSNAVTMTGGHCTLGGMALAKLCRDTLFADGLKAQAACERQVSTKALENVTEANIYLSGVGFETGGLACAHAVNDGLSVLDETHKLLHGEKVSFGLVTQLVLENASEEELYKVIRFLKACHLPTTFKDINLENVSDEQLLKVAEAACAEDETMKNMPFEVSPKMVVSAMKAADQIASSLN
jgi:glycerol dehydrogenase